TIIEPGRAPNGRNKWAAYVQVHVPIITELNALPFIHRLEVEAGWRYDQYSDFGGTRNPRVAVDWEPIEDLVLRWSWGTSFRAPAFSETSRFARVIFAPLNV